VWTDGGGDQRHARHRSRRSYLGAFPAPWKVTVRLHWSLGRSTGTLSDL
jgi:hypothetical protein